MTIDPQVMLSSLFPAAPCYVLRQNEVEMKIPTLLACTSPRLHHYLKPDLERLGLWEGERPTILLNTESIHYENGNRWGDGLKSVEQEELATVAIFIHELAHVIAIGSPFLWPSEFTDDEMVEQRKLLVSDLAAYDYSPPVPEAGPPWTCHHPRFLRLLCHLAFRAEKLLSCQLPSWSLLGGKLQGLNHISAYRAALSEEVEQLADVPMEQIPTLPAAKGFQRIVSADLDAWLKIPRKENSNAICENNNGPA